jgi:hypothetical protein
VGASWSVGANAGTGASECSRSWWDANSEATTLEKNAKVLSACESQLEENPSNSDLAGVVAEMRIKQGMLDDETEALVNQAFSAGEPRPMAREVEALGDGGQKARAETLIRKLSAIGEASKLKPYIHWLLQNGYGTAAIELLNQINFRDELNAAFLADLIRSFHSAEFVPWWSQLLTSVQVEPAMQLALAKQFDSTGDRQAAHDWYSAAAKNGSGEAKTWIAHDLYDGDNASRLVSSLSKLGFDVDPTVSALTDQVRHAISDFQSIGHLPETGAPDQDTLVLLDLFSSELLDRPAPTGLLSGIGRIAAKFPGRGFERGSGFLAGDRCTVIFSAHTFKSIDLLGLRKVKFYLGPTTNENFPSYSYEAVVDPIAMGLAINGEAISPSQNTDWVVGRLSPCAGNNFAPLPIAENDHMFVDAPREIFSVGYAGNVNASRLTELKCRTLMLLSVEHQCSLRGMSGGPVFSVEPTLSPQAQVVGINSGFRVFDGQRHEEMTPAPAFYLPIKFATSEKVLTASEIAEATDGLVRLKLVAGRDPSGINLLHAIITLQNRYGALRRGGLWYDVSGRYYSLTLDRDMLMLVRSVLNQLEIRDDHLVGDWCGEAMRLEIRHAPQGWVVRTGRGRDRYEVHMMSAGRYLSLEGMVGGARFAYEFYRDRDGLELLGVDPTVRAPGVPADLNGVIPLTHCGVNG